MRYRKKTRGKKVYFLYHYKMKEGRGLEVYLDGEKQEYCSVADVKYGFVVVLAKDEKGATLLVPDVKDVTKKYGAWIVKEGKVEIRKKENADVKG